MSFVLVIESWASHFEPTAGSSWVGLSERGQLAAVIKVFVESVDRLTLFDRDDDGENASTPHGVRGDSWHLVSGFARLTV